MSTCRLCGKSVSDGMYLSDGGSLHDECYESIQEKQQAVVDKIRHEVTKIEKINSEIQRRNSIGFKLLSIFSSPEIETNKLIVSISEIKINLSNLSYELEKFNSRLKPIYDYFLTYPPDWESRRNIVSRRDGEFCSRCRSHRNLHLHHKVALSKGGTNKIDNLTFLCEGCHSKEHGSRDFTGEFSHEETAFSKRVANIRYAIDNKRRVEFGYKKPTDKGHIKRTVLPQELTNVDHKKGSGATLCLRGFCELRKAERVFALKRMRDLKVL